MEKIAYFENMNTVAKKYWNSREEFEATKDKICEEYGYDSDEMKQYSIKAKEVDDMFVIDTRDITWDDIEEVFICENTFCTVNICIGN